MSDPPQAPAILDIIRLLQTPTGSVASIPFLTRDLEFPLAHFLLSDYVRPEGYNAGLDRRRIEVPLGQQP